MVIQIPVALWATDNSSSILSSSQITCVDTTKDGSIILVGLQSGVLCLCRIVDDDRTISSSAPSHSNFSRYAKQEPEVEDAAQPATSGYLEPYLALCGHSTAICALTETFFTVDGLGEAPPNAVVSASEDGTMVSWDPRDGRALCSAAVLAGKATQLKTLRSGRHVVACGHFPNIVVVTAATLVAVRVLPTHASAYVISGALFFFTESTTTLGEGFLTLSMDGTIESFALRTTKKQNRVSIVSSAARSPGRSSAGYGSSINNGDTSSARHNTEVSHGRDNNDSTRALDRDSHSSGHAKHANDEMSPTRKNHSDRSDGPPMQEGTTTAAMLPAPSSPSTGTQAHTAPIKRARCVGCRIWRERSLFTEPSCS